MPPLIFIWGKNCPSVLTAKASGWLSWNKWLKRYTTSFPLSIGSCLQGRCSHSKSVSSLLASAVALVSKKPYLGIAAAQRLRPAGLQVLEKGKCKEASLHSFWDAHTQNLGDNSQVRCEDFLWEVSKRTRLEENACGSQNGSALTRWISQSQKHCGEISAFHQHLWGQLRCRLFPPHQNYVWTLSWLNLFLTNPD